MELSGQQVARAAGLRAEVRGEGRAVGVDRHKNPLPLAGPLKDDLPVCEQQLPIAAGTQRFFLPVCSGAAGDEIRQPVFLRRIKAGTQRRVALLLASGGSPLAAVINAGYTRYCKQHRVNQRQVRGVLELARDAGDVVVIRKIQRVAADVPPAELLLEREVDFKEIQGVEARPQPLVKLIVGDAVERLRIHPLRIVAVQHLAEQKKAGLERVAVGAQPPQKVERQAVSHVQPQTVDPEFPHPAVDAGKNVPHHLLVLEVELHELVMPLPPLVGEAVAVGIVGIEAQARKPAAVRRALAVAPHVLKGPETPADVVENAVEHHADARPVQRAAYRGKVGVGAEPAVDGAEIPRVVAVRVGGKHRAEVHGVRAGTAYLPDPACHFADAVHRDAVVARGRAAETERINLIEYAVVSPHFFVLPAAAHAAQ